MFGWAWAKMGMASRVMGPKNLLYLKNELIKWADFLLAGANSEKLKVISMILGWVWSKMGTTSDLVHETLKSSVS